MNKLIQPVAYLHTCRDPGYSPYLKPCAECIAQLSNNSANRRKGKKAFQ